MKLNKNKLIHIVGVGGIGMSGIAEILSEMGYQVQGSDIKINANIVRLNKKKIKTFNSHKQSNLKNVSLVVYSSAISKNNIELAHSKKIKIPSISRAEILSQIVKLKKTIAISGSHGKTTTTSLISAVLNGARMKPTVINGGIINQFGTNTKLGSGDWLVVEADESDGTFVKLPASISVVTNIDKEHLDYYSNFQNLKNYFKRFITQVPFYGFAVICIDDNELRKLAANISTTKIIRTGFHRESDIKCIKLRHKANETIFDVFVKEQNQTIKNIKLPLHGAYNVNNALAAIAVGLQLNVKSEIIKKSLNSFKGVQRRLTELWSNNNIRVVDDYAHHPTEINNVLKGLVDADNKNRIITIFQPHRFSRVLDLKSKFTTCFKNSEYVFVSDVYGAGEKKPKNFDLNKFISNIAKNSKVKAEYFVKNDQLFELTKKNRSKIIFLFLGAGTVTDWAQNFAKELKKIYE